MYKVAKFANVEVRAVSRAVQGGQDRAAPGQQKPCRRNNELKADPLSDAWNRVRKTIATFWDIYARIWHGYELHGVANLPEGPGILVYYHGAIPIDYLYFLSRLFLWKKRLCLSVADHFVFRLPGLKLLLEVTGVIPGTREECLAALRNGYLVSISPGGVREALFSDQSYQLMWGNRKGFAQVALEAKVPIIPMYTQNVREGYRMFKERRFFRQLYESTRLPFTPPYGGLPVKFRTYIGKPIPYDPNITTEELVEKEMTGGNESCTAGPTSMSYLTCLTYILEEWTGVKDIGDYLSYAFYILWLFFPLVVVFVLPGVIVILFYVSILWLHIYKRKNEIKEAYSHDVWIGAREMLATIWDGHGRIWHGYELHGVENIPEGPGLVVFYHGATPLDFVYFTARLHIIKKRCCSVVADHFVFRLPGFRILLEVLGVIHGPKEACVGTLGKGHLLAIAPGGVREALFSDEMYTILWSDRKGFAHVAIDAKVLRTFIGEPIPYDPNMTAEELAAKTKAAVQALIEKHQKIPGNIFRALMERFRTQKKED
ncbi:Transmembrane protein [Turdus rufiventris]|nr:Transmembrane protein [Turdus rufiventris]